MLKDIESEEEGGRGIKREREVDIEEEKSSETTEEKSSGPEEGEGNGPEEEKGSESEEEGEASDSEEEEDSESEEEDDSDTEEGKGSEAEEEEEEGEDTCVYSEYEDRSGEPPEFDIDSEDEDDEYVRAYFLHMWRSEDFDALPGLIKGPYLSVIPTDSPYREAWWGRAKGCAEYAVKHYNKRRAGPDGKLEFVELTNVTSFGWFYFNVTFEATNLINGEKKVYQAKVERDAYNKFRVEFFRKKRNI